MKFLVIRELEQNSAVFAHIVTCINIYPFVALKINWGFVSLKAIFNFKNQHWLFVHVDSSLKFQVVTLQNVEKSNGDTYAKPCWKIAFYKTGQV